MNWLLDRIGDQTTKLWRFELLETPAQQLRENIFLAQTLKRETKGVTYSTMEQMHCPNSQRFIYRGGVADRPSPLQNNTPSTGIGPRRQSWQVYSELLQCCSNNVMINSITNFHDLNFAPNHWLPTKGRVQNAWVGGFGHQAKCLEVQGMGS